jgi:hypothetical protein
MKELLDKISTYNLFNYLLPGTLFVIIAKPLANFDLNMDFTVTSIALYYFIGMIISRIGSLAVEPILKKFSPTDDYYKYIAAAKADAKIEVLSEARNLYRTSVALVISLIVLKAYKWIFHDILEFSNETSIIASLVLLIVLFVLSHKKQTEYIRGRIDNHHNNNKNNPITFTKKD